MAPRHRRTGSQASVGSQQNGFANSSGEQSLRATDSYAHNNSNTTVNVAAAFSSATAQRQPLLSTRRPSRSPQPPANLALPSLGNRSRMLSPAAEKLQNSAQASGPVSYFLTSNEDDAINGTRSARSYRSGSEVSEDGDESSYGAEDAFVRKHHSNAAAGPSSARGGSVNPSRRNYSRYDDDAWRPSRTDSDGDSGAGDSPILPPRREMHHRDARGKRKDSAYLGGDDAATPRQRTSKAPDTSTPTMISMTRGDGNATDIIPVIPEEDPASPTPPLNRGPMPARAMAAGVSRNVAGVLLVDNWKDWFHAPRRWFVRFQKENRNWQRLTWAFVMLALAGLYLLYCLAALVVPSGPPKYHPPTQLPSSMEGLAQRLMTMEGHVQDLTTLVNKDRHDTVTDLRDLRDTIANLKLDLGSVATLQDSHGSAIRTLQSDMKAVQARVAVVERDIRAAVDDGHIKSALKRILPRHLPVRYDNKGSLSVDPHFYAELKKLFVGSGEVEQTVRKMISGGVQTPRDQWSVSKYERELEAWADRMFDRWTADAKYVERSEFVELVQKELQALKKDIKVSPGVMHGSPITVKTAKGEDVTVALRALIDAALLKYSKDTIAQPDYALFTAGARVIPGGTTPGIVLDKPSRLAGWLWGTRATEGRQPATALWPDNSVGSCWPFEGDKGTLSIMLARRVKVTAVTVEHAAHELAFDMGSAPRRMEVWMSIDGEENQAKAAAYLAKLNADASSGSDAGGTISSSRDLSVEETPERLLLTTFDYDATSATPIQTFPVPSDLIELGIDVGIVVFKVQSNWGGARTCLYRVRVHGEQVQQQVPAEAEVSEQQIQDGDGAQE